MSQQSELVTLSFYVHLQYETKAGRKYLVDSLKRFVHVEMSGAGVEIGCYSMKLLTGTEQVVSNENPRVIKRKSKL